MIIHVLLPKKTMAIESNQQAFEQWADEAKMIETKSKQLLIGQNS